MCVCVREREEGEREVKEGGRRRGRREGKKEKRMTLSCTVKLIIITFKISIFSFSLVGGLSEDRKGIAALSPEWPTISNCRRTAAYS